MCGACGVQSISFQSYQTRVYAYNTTDINCPTLDQLGRTGLKAEVSNGGIRLARIYNDAMSSGGWGTETKGLYDKGMYYHIDIFGATYT